MKMCSAFAGCGVDTVLYARKGEPSADPFAQYGVLPNFKLETLWTPESILFRKACYIAQLSWKILRGSKPDLFYGRDCHSLAFFSLLGRPLVYETHALSDRRVDNVVEPWLFRRPNFMRLVTISQALAEDYRARFPFIPESKILVAPDGADVPDDPIETEMSSNSTSRERCQVGYVGHLYPGKGLEVITQLAPKMPWVDFHIVGGTEKDLSYWKTSAVYENLTFHGFVNPGDLARCYAGFDIVLAPIQSRILVNDGKLDIGRWTSPLKIFEYMAHGKPMVASDLAVLREVLKNEENALLVASDNIDDWQNAITRLSKDGELRQKIAARARQDLAEKFSWDKRSHNVLQGIL